MPKGTRVHDCVDDLSKKYGIGKAVRVCQASTRQSYQTGKKISGGKKNGK